MKKTACFKAKCIKCGKVVKVKVSEEKLGGLAHLVRGILGCV